VRESQLPTVVSPREYTPGLLALAGPGKESNLFKNFHKSFNFYLFTELLLLINYLVSFSFVFFFFFFLTG
jgi:hypothetical protein